MIVEHADFEARLAGLLRLRDLVLADGELDHLAERYPRCGGRGQWDVREYAGRTGPGTREYRVVRGLGVREVYRSAERSSAAAVRAALNEMESWDSGLRPSA